MVSSNAVSPATGSGQRSAIFYRAMASVAPTDVLILAVRDGGGESHPSFPGARLWYAPIHATGARSGNPLRRMARNLRKLLFVETSYRPIPAAASRLRDLIRDRGYDLVVFRYFEAMSFCAGVEVPTCRMALDLDDRDDRKYAATLRERFGGAAPVAWLGNRLARRMRALLAQAFERLSLLWVVSEADRIDDRGVRCRIAPNVPFHAPEGHPAPASGGVDLLFVASAGHVPNRNGILWFLRECWPIVRHESPGARLRIVGSGGWGEVGFAGIDMTGVEVVGRVASIEEAYIGARASISPIFEGGGSKIKVVESCAFARPVVCTPHSVLGFEGLLADALLVGPDAATFARHCVDLLRDPARAEALGTRAMAAQIATFSLDRAVAHLRDDILGILAEPPRPPGRRVPA